MPRDERPVPELLREARPALPGGGWVTSEQPILSDGQLGEDLSRDPERVNPEGTADIARPIDAEPG